MEPKTCNNVRHLELIKTTRLDRCPSCNKRSDLEEAMTGVIKAYDTKEFVGIIEDGDGKFHLVKRNSMRRGTLLRKGLRVSFVSVNLSDGANAQQIRPCQEYL